MNSPAFPAGLNVDRNYGEFSYIHSVLQCFLMHPLMKEIINNSNYYFQNNQRFRLTNQMINLFDAINQGNIGNSKNIIDLFYQIAAENQQSFEGDNRYLSKDPYHFLYFFLHFLHLELNFSDRYFNIDNLVNASLPIKRQENLIQNIFAHFLISNHGNSLIFKYFLSSEKNQYLCNNCGIYYDFSINSIFTMYLPQIIRFNIKNNRNSSVTLDDCFECYCNDNELYCQHCNSNISIRQYKKIYNGKSLIIRFKRNSLGNVCDVNFPYAFDFSKFTGLNDGDINNRLYVLKSCISFNNNNRKYFADINVDVHNNSGKWIRYMDSQVRQLNNPDEIKQYEPQILIYELKNLEPNNNSVNPIRINPSNINQNIIVVNPYSKDNQQMNMNFIQGNFMQNNNNPNGQFNMNNMNNMGMNNMNNNNNMNMNNMNMNNNNNNNMNNINNNNMNNMNNMEMNNNNNMNMNNMNNMGMNNNNNMNNMNNNNNMNMNNMNNNNMNNNNNLNSNNFGNNPFFQAMNLNPNHTRRILNENNPNNNMNNFGNVI